MAFLAINKSDRVGTLYYDKESKVVPAQERVPLASVPKSWTSNIRVVELKDSSTSPKKAPSKEEDK